jgi:VDE lipocalin domain
MTYIIILVLQVLVLFSGQEQVSGFQLQHHQQQQQVYRPKNKYGIRLLLSVHGEHNNDHCTKERCTVWKNKNKPPRLSKDKLLLEPKSMLSSSLFPMKSAYCSNNFYLELSRHIASISLSISILLSSTTILTTIPTRSYASSDLSTSTTTLVVSDTAVYNNDNNKKSYDGFAEYAKENQMEQSDVSCFINKCGDETKQLFQNPRGIKGIVCLGQCKGEQACATRCFAEYGSTSLNNWLSCTIEDNECVKVPKSVDNSAENIGYSMTVKNFNPQSLVGTWYKTDGLNPNYDLFDCQKNTFALSPDSINKKNELDMGIFFRVQRPTESGGGYWENSLTEHMVVDTAVASKSNNEIHVNSDSTDSTTPFDENDMNAAGRTMHTSGKMYGLQFSENWYIIGESDGSGSIPPFKLVAYKGHTLQGNYEGAFVYAKESKLPQAARDAVTTAAKNAGLDFTKFQQIDNTCPSGVMLNDIDAGTGTTTNDWINLVIGEGGVIDWISPGWRGEYNNNNKPLSSSTTIASKVINSK